MINAGILIIGNEILSGRTLDKNSNFLCDRCSKIGISVAEIRIIPDEKIIIKKVVLDLSKKYNYVFVTGGIGPTHDDITADAIASAFNKKLILNKKAENLLIEHYNKSKLELNKSRLKMAFIPKFSTLILNPVSAAPGFKVNNVWVMAGVPKIMQAMFISSIEPKLKKGKKITSKSINVLKPEGEIAIILEKINKKYVSVNIGSYPYYLPPNIGTNIVFRGIKISLVNSAIREFCNTLKNKGITFSID